MNFDMKTLRQVMVPGTMLLRKNDATVLVLSAEDDEEKGSYYVTLFRHEPIPTWLSISICTNANDPRASDLPFRSIELMVRPDGTWKLTQYDWSSPCHQTGTHLFARAEDPGDKEGTQ